MRQIQKIGLGGGCHWCTEAVFQSLKGVYKVEQGFIASTGVNSSFSEAVIVHFYEDSISLKDIIAVHLHTHNSTSQHSMRSKYRSAVYVFSNEVAGLISGLLIEVQNDFDEPLITQVLPFNAFKPSDSQFHNYYFTDTERPFCKTHIKPKLQLLLDTFSAQVRRDTLRATEK
ncbi:MAG: peptide-methionine (S)-S-oxide reductase [Maribacter sp.]|jgi:peptide-methionine (S)-S-oxide reductase